MTFALLIVVAASTAPWSASVTVNGVDQDATISIFKPLKSLGADVPCASLLLRAPAGASLTARDCVDLASTKKLLALAKAYRRPKPLVQADTNALGVVEISGLTGEHDVLVETRTQTALFRVDLQPDVRTQLKLKKPDVSPYARRSELPKTKKRRWLIGTTVPWVASTDDPHFAAETTPVGQFALIEEDGNRLQVENDSVNMRATFQETTFKGVITKNGRAVRGASVLIASDRSVERTTTDQQGQFMARRHYTHTLVAFHGDACGIARDDSLKAEHITLSLEPCTGPSLQVNDDRGKALSDALVDAVVKRDESSEFTREWHIPGLPQGRFLLPKGTTKLTVAAPGFVGASIENLEQTTVQLRRSERFDVRVRSPDGVFLEDVSLRTGAKSSIIREMNGTFEVDSAEEPLQVEIMLELLPSFKATLKSRREIVVTPQQVNWTFDFLDKMIAPLFSTHHSDDWQGRRTTFSFWKPDDWPGAFLRHCDRETHICSLHSLDGDGGIAPSTSGGPVDWTLTLRLEDGGVAHGGEIEVNDAVGGERHVAKLDQLGKGTVRTSPGWFEAREGNGNRQWCHSSRPCVLTAWPEAARRQVTLKLVGADKALTASSSRPMRMTRAGDDEVVADSVPPGANVVVIDGTHVVRFNKPLNAALTVRQELAPKKERTITVLAGDSPLSDAKVSVGINLFNGEWSQNVSTDGRGQAALLPSRAGELPAVARAAGFEAKVVPAAASEIRLEPLRKVTLEIRGVARPTEISIELPPPNGFPPDLWIDPDRRERSETVGSEISVPSRTSTVSIDVRSEEGGWFVPGVTIARDATKVAIEVPSGKARFATLNSEKRYMTIFPGETSVPTTAAALTELLRHNARPSLTCTLDDCLTPGIRAGSAVVVMRSDIGSLSWKIDVPDEGLVLVTPPTNAVLVQ